MIFFATILIAFAVYLIHHFYLKRRHLPPGPTPLPIIGNLHSLARNPPGYKPFCDWKKQYGDVYTYWIGHIPVVAVASYDLIKETFIRDGESYAGRYRFEWITKEIRGWIYKTC
jgi:cytochrome P450 family 33